jgi:hypothetical protein
MRHGEVEHDGVELVGGHAGPHVLGEKIEGLGHESTGLRHASESLRSVQLDLGVARLGAGKFEIGHGSRLQGPSLHLGGNLSTFNAPAAVSLKSMPEAGWRAAA